MQKALLPSFVIFWRQLRQQVRPIARDDAAQLWIDVSDFIEARFKLLPNQVEFIGLQRAAMQKFDRHKPEDIPSRRPRPACGRMVAMGFNKRRMESERRAAAAKEAEARRALGPQILADAERLVAAWNARREAHMPMLFSPTIGAALTARHRFLWVRCPACRTTQSIDLRTIDRHRDAAVTRRLMFAFGGKPDIRPTHRK